MRIGRRDVLGLGLAAALPAAARVATPPQVEVSGGAPALKAAADDVAAYAARHLADYGLPGMTLALVAPGGFTALIRLGSANLATGEPVGPGHLFQIGSISKSLTAIAAYRQVAAGRLRLTDQIADLLPGAPVPKGVSLRHLLDHVSGLPDDAPIFPRGGDGRLWLGYAPGSHWSYSNLGYALVSEAVGRAAGRPFPEVLAETVLTPLGMTATRPSIVYGERARYAVGYSPFYGDRALPRGPRLEVAPWADMTEGAGSVASTGGDMARYLRWVIAGARGEAAAPLSADAAKSYFGDTADAPGWDKDARYGAGLAHVQAGGRTLLHHTGGMIAFSSAFHADPAAGVGAFASTNVGGLGYRPRAITLYACERMRAALDGASPPAPPPPVPPPEGLDAFAGRYVSRSGEALVAAVAGRGLDVQVGGRSLSVARTGEETFSPVDPAVSPLPLAFRGQGGAVARVWWAGVEYLPVRDGAPAGAYSPPTPPELARLVGTYANDDPWRGTFRVTAEGENLYIDGAVRLARRPDGSWRRSDEDWNPERLTFDAEIDGRPQRATFSGVDYVRRWA